MQLQNPLITLDKSHKILVAKDMTWQQVEIAVALTCDLHKFFIQQTSCQHGVLICDFFYN
jgi:hypothetical protein